MEVKLVLLLSALAVTVNCQFDIKNIGDMIGQTQHLQEIEKYGKNLTERLTNLFPKSNDNSIDSQLYPKLSNKTDDARVGGPSSQLPNSTLPSGGQQGSFNLTERFLNKTMTSMERGVCVKEVP